jgi:hypothetical protein
MRFTDPTYSGGTESIQGSFDKGEVAPNDDGSGRKIDFSGFYLGLSFRFYIEII